MSRTVKPHGHLTATSDGIALQPETLPTKYNDIKTHQARRLWVPAKFQNGKSA